MIPAHRETTNNHGSIPAIHYPEFLRRITSPKVSFWQRILNRVSR